MTEQINQTSLKRAIPLIILPLVLLQTSVLAQTPSPSPVNEQPSTPEVGTPTPKATPSPVLIPLKGTDQVRLELVNCGNFLDCGLARLLLPASALMKRYEIRFDNSTESPINVLNSAVFADGTTRYQLSDQKHDDKTPAFLLPNNIQTLPANQIINIPLSLNRSAMPPDQYSGALILNLEDRGRLSLPINLSVRSGPLLPVLVLFFGVILGRLFKYMQERGEPQANALKEVYRLQADIAAAGLEEQDKQLLLKETEELQTSVAREKLDVVPAEVQIIRDRLDTLVKLQFLENQFNEQAQSFPVDVDTFTLKIGKARRYIAQGEDAKAKDLLNQINTDLDNIGARGHGDQKVIEALMLAITKAATATEGLNKTVPTPRNPLNEFQKFMIFLSGVSDRVRAETTFWILRPLLSLVLLLGLSAAGISSLYIENGATFGARPFSDYLGLILWGLSADVASRSLSSLKGGNES